jgi:hypothetical protein
MKICQVVLVCALGISTGAVLGAQTLPAGTVLVASETVPGDGLPFPASLASGLEPLSRSLAPASSESNPPDSAASSTGPRPLTAQDRLTLFLNDTYASPGAFMALSAGAMVDQIRHTPAKWDEDGNGYTRRFASAYGQFAARNIIHDGLAGVTGLDPRYTPCKCSGTLKRSGHAFKMTFTTYRQDGRLTLDVPQLAGAYGSGMLSTYWYPHRLYNPLVQGVQFGHEQVGEIAVGNLVEEFGPEMKRALHLHSFSIHSHSSSADDE